MGLGPTVSMPTAMLAALPGLLKESGIRCREARRAGDGRRLRFGRFLAAAEAHVRETSASEVRLHLVCAHGMNPLMWWLEVRLVNRLEQLLLQNGATPCEWEDFLGEDQARGPDRGV